MRPVMVKWNANQVRRACEARPRVAAVPTSCRLPRFMDQCPNLEPVHLLRCQHLCRGALIKLPALPVEFHRLAPDPRTAPNWVLQRYMGGRRSVAFAVANAVLRRLRRKPNRRPLKTPGAVLLLGANLEGANLVSAECCSGLCPFETSSGPKNTRQVKAALPQRCWEVLRRTPLQLPLL